jgi:hypothetical protein
MKNQSLPLTQHLVQKKIRHQLVQLLFWMMVMIQFSSSRGTDASSLSINNVTGEMSFKSPADYEVKNNYSAIARVFDDEYFSQKAFQVFVINLNDNSPVFTSGSSFTVEENRTSIGIVAASDADGDSLTYSLSGTDASSLSINSSSGVMTFNSAPDYETKSSYSMIVTVSDGTNTDYTVTHC